MKPPYEWELQDINDLISASVEESLTLDYKASPALQLKLQDKKREFCKDISAFANTAGGTIVYGIEEVNDKPANIDNGLPTSDVKREQMEQIILSSIAPPIDNIRIKPIQLQNGNYIYVINIPQSNRAPHMHANKYYKRYNFTSQAMEHLEVIDTMRRSESPQLSHEIGILPSGNPKSGRFQIKLRNESVNPGTNLLSTLFVNNLLSIDWRSIPESDISREYVDIKHYKYRIDHATYPGRQPVWKGADKLIFDIIFSLPDEEVNFDIKVQTSYPGGVAVDSWRIYYQDGCFKCVEVAIEADHTQW